MYGERRTAPSEGIRSAGTMPAKSAALVALPDVPPVRPGDKLANLLVDAVERANLVPRHRDGFVIAQKIVSKPEGRYVDLADVSPSPGARQLTAAAGKDPRLHLSPACRSCRAAAKHALMHRKGRVYCLKPRAEGRQPQAAYSQDVLAAVATGHRAPADEALLLAEGDDLAALMAVAAGLRDEAHGDVVSYTNGH